MKERKRRLGEDDVLFTEERDVQERGTGDSLYHNIPMEAVRLLGISKGDTVEIDIERDQYVVRRIEE